MKLRDWRKSKDLTLDDAILALGLKSKGALSTIERGKTFPWPETIARIEGATRGMVTVEDHWATWRHAHPQEFAAFRAAGRTAAKSRKPAASTKARKNHG